MALTKKSWQDHLTSSFGQIDEGIRSRTGNDGLIVGGVMEGTATAVEHGDFAALHFDANQNLMVNIGDGEVFASLGTVDVLKAGSVVVTAGTVVAGTINNIASGSVVVTNGTIGDLDTVGTVGVLNAGSVVVTQGTIVAGTVNNIASGSIVVTEGTIGDLDTVGTVGVINDGTVAANSIQATLGTVTIASSDTTMDGTTTVSVNGLMKSLTFVTPNMEDTDSVQLDLKDPQGYSIYSSGTQAESATITANFGGTALDRPLYGVTTVIATAGTQSAAKDITFVVKTVR